MKHNHVLLALVLALILCASACCAVAEETPADYPYNYRGTAVEDFTVATIDGGAFTLSEALAEKDLVLINLWATWCGPCEMEFPYLEEAYEQYKDRVAVIALSVEPEDTDEVLQAYVDSHGMTFPVGNDAETGLGDIYALQGIPTSLIVDRFGNIGFIEVGSQTSTGSFTRVFDAFIGDDYTETTVLEDIPPLMPTVERASEEALTEALNAEGGALAFTNPEDEFVWPMIPAEKDGRTVLTSTNAGQSQTTATVLTTVSAAAGEALAFDFATSTEAGADLLTVEVDGERAKVFGGEHDWATWVVALTEGEHQVALSYVKDYYDEAGEDAVWVDNVRLVSAEEAAELEAAKPVYPNGEAFEVKLTTEGAKEIVFEGDEDGALLDYFGSQSYWIVPGDTADVEVILTADIDPEAAFIYCNYNGTQMGMMNALNEDGTAYVASSGIDSMETTGYSYTNIYCYPFAEVESYEEVRGVMFFSDEKNVNALVADLAAEDGLVVTWHYADGDLPATDEVAVAAEDAGESAYTVTFTDQNGDPVPGCIINFCTDESCVPTVADENGVAVFTGMPYAYHLQVIKVPEGYEFDTTQEFYAEEAGGELSFTVNKQ